MSVDLVLSILVTGIVGLAALWFWKRFAEKKARPSFSSKPILDKNEAEIFKRLCAALPVSYIFPKVAIGTLLAPESANLKRTSTEFSRICQKTIDFAVYDTDLKLVCVITLGDPDGNPETNALIDACFKSAKIKTVRWDAKARPTVDQISRYILPMSAQGKSRPSVANKEVTDTVLLMYRDDPTPSNRSGLTVPTLDKLTPNKVLLNSYPHIWQRICVFAPEPKHLQKYLISLSLQDRGEKRAGFTLEALQEMADISRENDRFLLQPEPVWQPGMINR